jgi:hypothetical protein
MTTRDETIYRPGAVTVRALSLVAAAGAFVFLLGLALDPRRAWTGYLLGFNFFVGLGLSGGLFLALLSVSSARWAAPLQRVPVAMSRSLPVGAALGIVLLFGVHSLYEWSHASVVEEDALLRGKSPYLNLPFFAIRLVAYFALWIVLSRVVAASPRGIARSALFVAVFAVTYSLASVDWIQSLEPHWFSTIFALRTATGLACGGLAAAIVILLLLRSSGPLRGVVTDDHVHDLSKLLFSFSILWGYIRYCQYMLIWYSNIPEETAYYLARGGSAWKLVSLSGVILMWGVPFLVLLTRKARRSSAVLLRVAFVVLAGWAFDLYVLIGPPLAGAGGGGGEPSLGIFEVASLCGAAALFFLVTLKALSRAPLAFASESAR